MSGSSRRRRPPGPLGTRHGYHAVTLGWYESELIRHADRLGRSLGQFFADEVPNRSGWSSTSACRPRWTVTGLRTCTGTPEPRCCYTSGRVRVLPPKVLVVRKLASADRMLGEGKDVADVCRELGWPEFAQASKGSA